MKEEQLNAFKDGVANALLDGDVDEDLKNKYCRHSYQQDVLLRYLENLTGFALPWISEKKCIL